MRCVVKGLPPLADRHMPKPIPIPGGAGMKVTLEQLAGDDLPLLTEFEQPRSAAFNPDFSTSSSPFKGSGTVDRSVGHPPTKAHSGFPTFPLTSHCPGNKSSQPLPDALSSTPGAQLRPDQLCAAAAETQRLGLSKGEALAYTLDSGGVQIWESRIVAPQGFSTDVARIARGLGLLLLRGGSIASIDMSMTEPGDIAFFTDAKGISPVIVAEYWSVFDTPKVAPRAYCLGNSRHLQLSAGFQSKLIAAYRLIA